MATPIQVGSRQPIKVGLATPIQVGSRQPTKIGYGNNIKSGKLTSNASYFTAKLSDVEELVRFWHINLGHMSKQKIITTVENNNIDGLAEMVSVQQINKYFPDCPDCVHANLAQKSHPKLSDIVYEISKTLAIDVFEPGSEKIHTEKKGRKNSVSVMTHTGERYAVICKDRGSDRSWVFLTPTLSRLLEYIKRMDRMNLYSRES